MRATRRFVPIGLTAGLAACALAAAGCGNECDFFSRCDGNTRQVCGGGVDQQVNRKIVSTPCAGENPVCVEENGHAICAVAASPRCDSSTPDRCEGDVAVACSRADWDTPAGFVTRTDCATAYAAPARCTMIDPSAARCQR